MMVNPPNKNLVNISYIVFKVVNCELKLKVIGGRRWVIDKRRKTTEEGRETMDEG